MTADLHSTDPRSGRGAGPADLVAGFDGGAAGRDVFSIRDLTKELGVSARTLRFYEEKGLVAPRRNGQERRYSRRDRARLKYVLMGKAVGFSLEEVREMLDLLPVPISLENPVGDDGDSTVGDFVEDPNVPDFDALGAQRQMRSEVASILDELSPRERVRQIEMEALQKLRHPSRSHRLKAFVDY